MTFPPLGSVLRDMDHGLGNPSNTGVERPTEDLLHYLQGIGMPANARLRYIPQPYPPEQWIACSHILSHDNNFNLFLTDAIEVFKGDKAVLAKINPWRHNMPNGFQFLTGLDALACMPEALISERFSKEVREYGEFLDWMQTCLGLASQYSQGDSFEEQTLNCFHGLFLLRNAFYVCRRRGVTRITEIHRAMDEPDPNPTPDTYQFPSARFQDLGHEIIALQATINTRVRAVRDRFYEVVKLGPVFGFTAVEEFTTPVANTTGVDCIVCLDYITPPAVETACQHVYCKECLKAWIQSCQSGSHTCPYCRAEMFPEPRYRRKVPAVAENFQQELHRLGRCNGALVKVAASYAWLKRELDLEAEIMAPL